MGVCGILLCFQKSSTEEEDQDMMDGSELLLLKRERMQEGETEHANPSPGLVSVIPGRTSSRIVFSSALCLVPEDSSSLEGIFKCCCGWVSITGGSWRALSV